jgi:hypothetical protein
MKQHLCIAAIFAGAVFVSSTGSMWAQEPQPSSGAPPHMIVTVEPKHGNNPPEINKSEVMVYEGHDRDTVTDWIPAQGDRAALELFILIDDSSSSSLGSQLEDLRQFITAQRKPLRSEWHTCRTESRALCRA